MKKIIIAIDGLSSCGKSTMARHLASRIGYRYVDSGAMYRAVTLYAMRHNMIADDGTVEVDRLIPSLPDIKIDFTPATAEGEQQHTRLNGEDVEREIRDMAVSSKVSFIAAIPQVRHALVAMQQEMGKEKGIVMDGRDIGTTVFPEAELKVFVTASAQTRAQRRVDELLSKGEHVNFAEVLANVVERDRIDQNRAESPLRRAEDAIELDNSTITIDQQAAWLEELYERKISES